MCLLSAGPVICNLLLCWVSLGWVHICYAETSANPVRVPASHVSCKQFTLPYANHCGCHTKLMTPPYQFVYRSANWQLGQESIAWVWTFYVIRFWCKLKRVLHDSELNAMQIQPFNLCSWICITQTSQSDSHSTANHIWCRTAHQMWTEPYVLKLVLCIWLLQACGSILLQRWGRWPQRMHFKKQVSNGKKPHFYPDVLFSESISAFKYLMVLYPWLQTVALGTVNNKLKSVHAALQSAVHAKDLEVNSV